MLDSWDEIAGFRQIDRTFEPQLAADQREARYRGWQDAYLK